MLPQDYRKFLREIGRAIPAGRIHTDQLTTFARGTDAGFYRLTPRVVIDARGEDEVRAILAAATRHAIGVTFRAAGTSLSGQSSTDGVLVRVMEGWDGCEILDGGRAIRTGPGARGGRLNALLKPLGRKIGPDPASIAAATIGGMVANNASGMNGADENSYRTLRSIRLILPDGTMLDTGRHDSREDFLRTHNAFIANIIALRDATRADTELSATIRRKYSIKNTTGLNIAPFVDFDDPLDIIAHLMVGSEGTLAFIAGVELATLPVMPARAAAMLYFPGLAEACRAVQKLRPLGVATAELLDRGALRAVENERGIPDFIRHLPDGAAALLIELKAEDGAGLETRIAAVGEAILGLETLRPADFTTSADALADLWRIRSGVFPAVGARRPAGSACLIEDVVFPLDRLPEAVTELRALLDGDYPQAVIYGHAAEGNFHFILTPDLADPREAERFGALMESVVGLVGRFGGSLKGEHGTGRNVAPFVEREWGPAAFALMGEVKRLFDPAGVLGPGVIFNPDPRCHLRPLKTLTVVGGEADRCIECGFCEPGCVTAGLTLSARERIAVRREIVRLEGEGLGRSGRLNALRRSYRRLGTDSCAGDGLCALRCPVAIDTGAMVRDLRGAGSTACSRRVARTSADRFAAILRLVRPALGAIDVARRLLGQRLMGTLARGMHRLFGLPLWTPAMPRPTSLARRNSPVAKQKVVYFPSCINRTMGPAAGDPTQEPLHSVFTRLLERAGYEVIMPENVDNLCCGTIWHSKGFAADADRKTAELAAALRAASDDGRNPIVCDQSPCLSRMREKIDGLDIHESLEFLENHAAKNLTFRPTRETIALHITCSTTKRDGGEAMRRLAARCAERIVIPEGIGCCGFAGDKGFTRPEVNAHALRDLRRQIDQSGAKTGYSDSRTCEVGLTTHGGIPYRSLVYLVEECTRPRPE